MTWRGDNNTDEQGPTVGHQLSEEEMPRPEESLRANFEKVFALPEDCIEFLLKVWRATQVFDDVADGDQVNREELDSVIWDFFVGFGACSFFANNYLDLRSQLANLVLKWQASDEMERSGRASAKSYMWRAGYYDLVLSCCLIVHGPEIAKELSSLVLDLYGETFEGYQEEFKNA